MKTLEEIWEVKKLNEEELIDKKNALSVGIGYVHKGNHRTSELGIVVNVGEKVGIQALRKKDRIPSEIDGVRVDVFQSGELVKESYRQQVFPLTCGYSVGNSTITAGTLGYPAKRDGVVGITSNAHVFCSDPSKGMDEQDSRLIVQPGPLDGGDTLRAELGGYYVIDPTRRNKIDSAWARLNDPEDYTLLVPELGFECGVLDTSGDILGENINKVGRTTGVTNGRVTQIDVLANVSYGSFVAKFEGCVATENMSSGGDSGSIGFTDYGTMKYRLFAGSNVMSIFFDLNEEVSDLNLVPLTEDTPEPPTPPLEDDFKFKGSILGLIPFSGTGSIC